MKRKSVISSNINSAGYDESRRILEIEFSDYRVYQYYSVPPFEYKNLLSANSIGEYFDSHIKNGPYSYHRL